MKPLEYRNPIRHSGETQCWHLGSPIILTLPCMQFIIKKSTCWSNKLSVSAMKHIYQRAFLKSLECKITAPVTYQVCDYVSNLNVNQYPATLVLLATGQPLVDDVPPWNTDESCVSLIICNISIRLLSGFKGQGTTTNQWHTLNI